MKKLFYLLTLSLFVFTSCEQEEIIDLNSANKKAPKVTICHYDAEMNSWTTISINENALKAHLAHGDQLGDCSERRTYVPNDVFEWWLIYSGYDDIMDNYVLTSNISSIERLRFGEAGGEAPWYHYPYGQYFFGIEDFTGIEDFKSLKSLSINAHYFKTLDLSKNKELTQLSLRGIHSMETPLDLTKNIALEGLGISECLSIKSLDLSNNISLTRVYFESNPYLTSINLKNGKNKIITNFESYDNSRLSCIEVDNPDWSYDNWYWNEYSGYTFSKDCGY